MRSGSGRKPANAVDAYFLTGGVHAREWGSCDILVNLAADLCEAYAGGTGVGYGGKYFSAAEVKALIEQINVIIFPCVNPDGRNFSQNTGAIWRKNRNPAGSGGDRGADRRRHQPQSGLPLGLHRPRSHRAHSTSYLASNDPAARDLSRQRADQRSRNAEHQLHPRHVHEDPLVHRCAQLL